MYRNQKLLHPKKRQQKLVKQYLKKNNLCDNIISSTSEDENYKNGENKEYKEEYETLLLVELWKRKYADLEEQFNHLKIEMLALKDENYRYRGLNIILHYYKLFGNAKQATKFMIEKEISKTRSMKMENNVSDEPIIHISNDIKEPNIDIELVKKEPDEQKIHIGNDIKEPNTDIELVKTEPDDERKIESLPRYTVFKIIRNDTKINRIHLGNGIVIDEDIWEIIQTKRQDSKFVKDLAVAIWGRHVLINRSLDGKAGQRLPNQEEKRKMLTPSKRQVLKMCFEDRLRKQNVKGEQFQNGLKKMGCYLTELINDLIKREKKEIEKGR